MYRYSMLLLLCSTLVACGGNDSGTPPATANPPPTPVAQFELTITNLTNNQPLSPAAVVVHRGGFQVFTVGTAASLPLEVLAEGGDNSDFVADAQGGAGVLEVRSGAGPIGPGASESFTFDADITSTPNLFLSIATMLVNTNDAFSGANRADIGGLAVGDTRRLRSIAYDAGTEADSEAAGTIPGPAVGGEGFNPARDDDADQVTMHGGVISNETGLATSVLTSQERFDNPVLQISVTRTQ